MSTTARTEAEALAAGWLRLPGGAVRLADVTGWRLDHDDAGPVAVVVTAGGPLLWRGADAAAVCKALWAAFSASGSSDTGHAASGGAGASHGRQRATADSEAEALGSFLRRVADAEGRAGHG